MMKHIFALGCLLCLLACNATSEISLNEAFPSEVSLSPSSAPQTSPTETSATPSATASVPSADSSSPPKKKPEPTQVKQLALGDFQNAAHKVSGQVKVLQLAQTLTVRLENFKTENGPNLHLYLVKDAKGGDSDGFLDLGSLKSVSGQQNYTLPEDVKIQDYQAVTVWCQPFRVNFGFAPLKKSL